MEASERRHARLMIGLAAMAVLGGSAAAGADEAKPELTVLQPGQAFALFGAPVVGPDHAELGRVWNLLVDRDHHPIAAVIDYGGFMGVGHRKVAVSWAAIHFGDGADAGTVRIDLDAHQLGEIPEYAETGPVTLGGLAAADAAKPK